MTVMLGFSDGDAFAYESKYATIEKVMFDLQSKRFVIHEGVYYFTDALVKVSPL